jgi:hypothetical protein
MSYYFVDLDSGALSESSQKWGRLLNNCYDIMYEYFSDHFS